MTRRLEFRLTWTIIMLLLAFAINGCSTPLYSGPIFQGQRPLAVLTPVPKADVPSDGPSTNRLLIVGADGNLYTADPDGGRVVALTRDASSTRQYSQPTWSPDGEQIAWTRIDDGTKGHMIVSQSDGTEEIDRELPFPPFFYNWSSSGERLAFLSNWTSRDTQTLALHLVDLTTADSVVETIVTGQPLYFSWSPTNDFLLTHTGNQTISIVALSGRSTVLSRRSANFGAPQWLADPALLAYAVVDGNEQQIVVGNLRSGQVENLTYFRDALSFSLSPNGHKLAYTDSEGGQGMNSFGSLLVLDVRSTEFRQLSSQPVLAFFWSPDSSSLYYMVAELSGGGIGLRLFVWNGETTIDLGRYQPSATLLNQYLRFGDQYGQSATYWSPDSRHVIFSGRSEGGANGIWVIPADGSAPQRVARGVYATWTRN